MKKSISFLFVCIAAIFCIGSFDIEAKAAGRVQQTGETVCIVIDPGHGGDNEGTIEGNEKEKNMTLTTAKAMYEALSEYEGVAVYLTHDSDVGMSIKDRAEYAASVHADYIISLHYNASINHELYGSEVWIPYSGLNEIYGYQLGNVFLKEFEDMGMHIRGVKTRRNTDGDNYYGIIRESETLGIPSIIVEHSHVDNSNDSAYVSELKQVEFGKADARAVAKYFGLHLKNGTMDYASYCSNDLVAIPEGNLIARVTADVTEPEKCEIKLTNADYENGKASFHVAAEDSDGMLCFYRISLDGGDSFGELVSIEGSNTYTGDYNKEFDITISVPDGICPGVVVQVYNQYDLKKNSNEWNADKAFGKVIEAVAGAETGTAESKKEAAITINESDLPDHEDAVTEGEAGLINYDTDASNPEDIVIGPPVSDSVFSTDAFANEESVDSLTEASAAGISFKQLQSILVIVIIILLLVVISVSIAYLAATAQNSRKKRNNSERKPPKRIRTVYMDEIDELIDLDSEEDYLDD